MESFDVGAGDYVLCFSDGVSGNLALNEIARLVSAVKASRPRWRPVLTSKYVYARTCHVPTWYADHS